ncbi:protein kinase [Streptomyces scopuliridis]|uniref:Protein kinase n=1 Tax=Streptomyces scopuliridis TaxID=452529 RepID=A0ACD4ZMB1_9ACTN|nr:protein kinase [Streptomyces scopuliridis]WSB98266.1 protein kinase [Streptomyces scopuliridis]WSC08032.1 protein kinase [Streptomyces scopuliridis]
MEQTQSTGTDSGGNAVGAGPLLAGRYRLAESIGSGGMGKVWRAHDEVLHRVVAIKELTAGRYVSEADRAVLHQRTQKEARAAARISHPAVVTVHDVLEHDGRPWIVMQYVDGPSLADAVKESGRIDHREAARIGLAVLGALRAAHAAGVLHRDVKPGNVLLARDGRVLLTDFGIAAIEGDSTITRTGELIGSIDYLAPERVRGGDPGPASDLWSLGVTLYTAVQGVSPFRRSSPLSTMQAVVTDEPDHPDHAGPLAPVIAGLLRKDPDGRPGAERSEHMLREVAEGRTAAGAEEQEPTRHLPYGERQSAAAQPQPAGPPFAPAVTVPATGPVPGPTPSSPTVPAPQAPPSGPGRRNRWRTTLVAVVVAAVLGGGAGFAALKYADDGSSTDNAGGQSANEAPADDTTAGDGPAGGPTEGPTDGATADGTAGEGDAGSGTTPEGWTRVEAEEGFSLNVPQGWERQVSGDQIDYTPDNGRHLIRISVGTPDFDTPYAHMLSMEKSVQNFPEYARLQLAPNNYRDKAKAALWEFTWTEKTGNPGKRHAIDQIYYSDDSGTEYAIYMAGPEEDWATTRKQFDAVLRSWQAPATDTGQ